MGVNFTGYYDNPDNLSEDSIGDSNGLIENVNGQWDAIAIALQNIDSLIRKDITYNKITKEAYTDILETINSGWEEINTALTNMQIAWRTAQEYGADKLDS